MEKGGARWFHSQVWIGIGPSSWINRYFIPSQQPSVLRHINLASYKYTSSLEVSNVGWFKYISGVLRCANTPYELRATM